MTFIAILAGIVLYFVSKPRSQGSPKTDTPAASKAQNELPPMHDTTMLHDATNAAAWEAHHDPLTPEYLKRLREKWSGISRPMFEYELWRAERDPTYGMEIAGQSTSSWSGFWDEYGLVIGVIAVIAAILIISALFLPAPKPSPERARPR